MVDSVFFTASVLTILWVLYWAAAVKNRRRARGEPSLWWWWVRGVPAWCLVAWVAIGVSAWRASGGHWVRPGATLAEDQLSPVYQLGVTFAVFFLGFAWLFSRRVFVEGEPEETNSGRVPWWSGGSRSRRLGIDRRPRPVVVVRFDQPKVTRKHLARGLVRQGRTRFL
ncbi:MAG: hypothetical protein ACRD2X_06485 [Vicinamibacteraceae bacterium]